jgi:hypothetical protein
LLTRKTRVDICGANSCLRSCMRFSLLGFLIMGMQFMTLVWLAFTAGSVVVPAAQATLSYACNQQREMAWGCHEPDDQC